MNIPNSEHAIVEHEKVRDCLLNEAHPDGYGKAEFLLHWAFGERHERRWLRLYGGWCGTLLSRKA